MSHYNPGTLGGVDDMVRDRRSHGLYAICLNVDCPRCTQAVKLDLKGLIERFGRYHLKQDVLITCSSCKAAGRDRTKTTLAVGFYARIR